MGMICKNTGLWHAVKCIGCACESVNSMETPKEARPKSLEFVRKTTADYAAWCAEYYRPESLDEHGMKTLDGLWAWQEQERRHRLALAKEREEWAEIVAQLIACHDEPDCPAVALAKKKAGALGLGGVEPYIPKECHEPQKHN